MDEIKRDWNSMARAYEEFNNTQDSYSYTIEWQCIRNLLPNLNGKTVVDLGCGTGIFTFLLEQNNPQRLQALICQKKCCKLQKTRQRKTNLVRNLFYTMQLSVQML